MATQIAPMARLSRLKTQYIQRFADSEPTKIVMMEAPAFSGHAVPFALV
jgi:hypothetical protein